MFKAIINSGCWSIVSWLQFNGRVLERQKPHSSPGNRDDGPIASIATTWPQSAHSAHSASPELPG